MIKINLSKTEIDKIKQEHFENLYNDNKFKGKSFSLKNSLENEISNQKNSKEFIKLLNYLNTNIKDIITGKPEELEKIITGVSSKHKILNSKIQVQNTKYGKKIREIFNYKGFNKLKNYKSYDLIKKLNISVCLYCNRNYIFSSENINTCELDHFYSQEKYPYLALSFYNLIPSCHTCNHKKSSKD